MSSRWGNAKPIETVYKGYRFRSRLEARWAVFFDALEVKWEYELEGFNLDGVRYLPDFWLPNVTHRRGLKGGVWVEVKPGIEQLRESPCGELAISTQKPVLVVFGSPIDREGRENPSDGYYEFTLDGSTDNCMTFMKCFSAQCGHVKVEFDEGNYMVCPVCHGSSGDTWGNAYAAARQARFERGR